MQMWTGKDLPWDVTMLEDGQRYLPPGGWTQDELADFVDKRDMAWNAACAKKVSGPDGALEHRMLPYLERDQTGHRVDPPAAGCCATSTAWDCVPCHHWLPCLLPAAGTEIPATMGGTCQGAATWHCAGI